MEAQGAGTPPQFDRGQPQGGPPGPAAPVAAPQPAAPQEQGEPVEGAATPLVDVVETPDELIVIADVPGFEEEAISLQADDSTLLLVATREDGGDDEYRVISAERPRRLERVVQLPPNGDVDGATATYDAGVCTVRIPKGGGDRREIGFH